MRQQRVVFPVSFAAMRSLSLVLVLSLSSSCAVEASGGNPEASEPPTDATTHVDQVALAPIEAEPAPAPDPHAQLADCPGSASADRYCTEAGKLAGQWGMVDMVRVPKDAQEIFAAAPEHSRQPSLHIAVEGEVLYIRKVSCGNCARIMGEGFRGQLDALSEAQLLELAARLGLDAGLAPLRTAQAWRDYASGEGREALVQIAAQSIP